MLLDAWLPRAAAIRPARAAIATPAATLTYTDLHERATAAAGALAARGARPGTRVALALPPGVAFAEALHACLLLGAVATPVDPRLAPAERAARTAGAAAVVEAPLAGDGVAPAAVPARVRASHDTGDLATLMHTSGTSGDPKPVGLTYGNWLWNALGSAAAIGLDPGERWLCTLPLAHVGGLSILLRSAIAATTVVLHDRFETSAALRALREDGITVVSLVPTTLARLLDAGLDRGGAPALRCALLGGAPAPPGLLERAAAAGVPIAQTYGLTEACSQVATSPPGEPETAGRPLVGTRMEIAAGGEILVAGPTVAPGALGPDGWLHTGDLGRLDERGRLLVTGRRSEIIVTGGENVAPAEVEEALERHPAVAEAAAHGRPDPEWGEAVVATVVRRDGVSVEAEELRAHCAASLARFKVPKEIAFADALPRTASGKLRRGALGAVPAAGAGS